MNDCSADDAVFKPLTDAEASEVASPIDSARRSSRQKAARAGLDAIVTQFI